jgi:hypothetical protein
MSAHRSTVFVLTAAMMAVTGMAHAQTPVPIPWMLTQDMGYGYASDGKTLAYKMGTDNAKFLLKGAKKVPPNTLFFVGANGQLYMRTGPYLERDGKFMFGPS